MHQDQVHESTLADTQPGSGDLGVEGWLSQLLNEVDVPDEGQSYGHGTSGYAQGGPGGVNEARDNNPTFWKDHTDGNDQTRQALKAAAESRNRADSRTSN